MKTLTKLLKQSSPWKGRLCPQIQKTVFSETAHWRAHTFTSHSTHRTESHLASFSLTTACNTEESGSSTQNNLFFKIVFLPLSNPPWLSLTEFFTFSALSRVYMHLLEHMVMREVPVFPEFSGSISTMGDVYYLLFKTRGILFHLLLPSLPSQSINSFRQLNPKMYLPAGLRFHGYHLPSWHYNLSLRWWFFSSTFALLRSIGSYQTEWSFKNVNQIMTFPCSKGSGPFHGTRNNTYNLLPACKPSFGGSQPRAILSSLEGTCGNVWEHLWLSHWRRAGYCCLVGGGQRCCETSYRAQDGPLTKSDRASNWEALLFAPTAHCPVHFIARRSPCRPLKTNQIGPFLIPVPLQARSHHRASVLIAPWASNASPLYSVCFPLNGHNSV